MNLELSAVAKTITWTLVPLPKNKKPIDSKWVYKIKYRSDSTVECYKARLVANGYNQVEGVDYFNTFAPVAKLTTVRLLLAVVAVKNWHLYQLDVNNVFLHDDLNEEVYMKPPQGLIVYGSNMVCKLNKILYGLNQAIRMWFEKLFAFLKKMNFIQSFYDNSLFIRHTANLYISILVYVDDMLICADNAKDIADLKILMNTNFQLKDLGELR
jgi:hypothetical protein